MESRIDGYRGSDFTDFGCRCGSYNWQREFSSIAIGSMTGGPVPRGECASPVRCDAGGEQKIKPSTIRPWPLRRDPNSRRLAGPCGGDTEPAGAAAEHPGRVAFVLRRRGSELDPSRARQPRGYACPAHWLTRMEPPFCLGRNQAAWSDARDKVAKKGPAHPANHPEGVTG